jgi:hypothetical protein
MSIEEIGSALSLKGSATKNSIFRAVRRLRKELEPLVMAQGGQAGPAHRESGSSKNKGYSHERYE